MLYCTLLHVQEDIARSGDSRVESHYSQMRRARQHSAWALRGLSEQTLTLIQSNANPSVANCFDKRF